MLSLDLTPHATARHWSARWVGRAWSPDWTCWALVREVQAQVFGRALPPVDDVGHPGQDAVREAVQGWRRVEGPEREGDVLLMRNGLGLLHVGVAIGPGRVLHLPGGLDAQGKPYGEARVDTPDGLAQCGYGHLRLWRAVA